MTHTRTAPAPDTGTLPDDEHTAAALAGHRPDLLGAYRAHLPCARAAILARLWGAYGREPLPWVASRTRQGGELRVTCVDGRGLSGPAAAAEAFAVAAPALTVHLDGHPYEHPAHLAAALQQHRLAAELANSVANLALARAAANTAAATSTTATSTTATNPAATNTDVEAAHEQSVVDGHPLHPCCRTRGGMSTADVLRYAPEHRPVVDLVIVEVPPSRWLCTGTPRKPLLPVHPLQLHVALEAGLRPTGATVAARPLMSLRTLAPVDGGPHVKTSVYVQMTSAVRIVSPAAVRNGPAVSGLLAELAGRTGDLGVMREISAATVLVDGAATPGLAAVWRERPTSGTGLVAMPFAALVDHPAFVRDHFDELVRLVLAPALTLLDLGVALEAHGQNLLLVLRAGRPAGVRYRDIGGLRISLRRLAGAGVHVPPPHGDLAEDDPAALRAKLFASAVSTVVGELVALLGRHGGDTERLWDRVALVCRGIFAALPARARDDARALFEDPWPVKAMTAMRLAADPVADVWAYLPNPLVGRR